MNISIQRSTNGELQTYNVELENATLLTILNHIKTKQDPTLTYSHGCRSGVCGSCAVRVNGREQLMCEYKPSDGDIVEPIRNARVIRDLVVDSSAVERFNRIGLAWNEASINEKMSSNEMAQIETQSDCILCTSCFSACPVYSVNPDFIGPFALTRVWRYVNDPREQNSDDKIAAVQTNGIWDCTLCGECVPVCPQNIAPAQDIRMLRTKSGMMGYSDPNMESMFGGGLDFGSPMF
ncbi:MAG: 2Fe-2S iron-sulfur cluster-binding protein [Sulfuricurvum sp.]|uniref:succinate dehydrogenase/fumarate reductase iron-sulfur subunit n=1 Tax=Sulfuricurvum sp. TaxID=2025608 RepID=UPI002608D4B3|nr:2Fe-2S iron-sulfur cluster-binding protein [Sulfuricurvum sp.]MDD2828364.1 2Fe-2S iron-sulfur cluster-binding protein [Sulfuricurvum sp.]MDD4949369.1 2Fe-2S iron-sulfur cluster-binding protein [Sulfuricurvum sp.]